MAGSSERVPKSVIARAFLLLHAFNDERGELGLAELCDRTGLSKTTLHRLAAQLVGEGALERTDNGYRLGMCLFELGELAVHHRSLQTIVLPHVAELARVAQDTVHFGVLDGNDVIYLQRLSRRRSTGVATRTGGRMPAYCTGLGKALLAFSDEQTILAVIAQGLRRRTPHTITVASTFRSELIQVASQGYAEDREEAQLGIRCLAMPIFDRSGAPIASLSLTTTADRYNKARFLSLVRSCVEHLSQDLRRNRAATSTMPAGF